MAKKEKKQVVFEDDGDEPITLTVNESFGKRFEEQERKRELAYLTSKGLLDDDEDDSESSDESSDEDPEAHGKLDEMLSKVMKSIKKKDPKIFDKNTKWFDDDEETSKATKTKQKNPKKMTYKDVVREQILEDAATLGHAKPTLNDDEDEDDGDNYNDTAARKKKSLLYDAEQKKLREAFISGLDDDEDEEGAKEGDEEDSSDNDGGGLLAVKNKGKSSVQEDVEASDDESEDGTGGDATDKFLQDFLANKRWKENTKIVGDCSDEDDEDLEEIDDDEDLEEVDAMEQFESKYNFRFEEEEANRRAAGMADDGDSTVAPSMRGLLGDTASAPMQVQSYSRTNVAGTMRRKDEKRKTEREVRKERKANERLKIEEELRRLKNLKKKEIEKKLLEISEIGGIEIDQAMLEGDFDPEQFDKMMQQSFGDDYYANADADEKHKINPLDDEEDDDDVDGQDDDEVDDGADDTEDSGYAKSMVKEHQNWSKSLNKASVAAKKLMEEAQQYDYDDIIDDTPTRFRYASVEPESYGLTTEEILAADDNLLNSFVSLKKVAAPYGHSSVPVNAKKRKQFREALKNKKLNPDSAVEVGEDGVEVAAKKKRKRRRGKHSKKDGEEDGGDVWNGDNAVGHSEDEDDQADETNAAAPSSASAKKSKKSISLPEEMDGGDDAAKEDEADAKAQKVKNHKKRNNNKKKKSGAAKTIAGVNSSRLASYGIA